MFFCGLAHLAHACHALNPSVMISYLILAFDVVIAIFALSTAIYLQFFLPGMIRSYVKLLSSLQDARTRLACMHKSYRDVDSGSLASKSYRNMESSPLAAKPGLASIPVFSCEFVMQRVADILSLASFEFSASIAEPDVLFNPREILLNLADYWRPQVQAKKLFFYFKLSPQIPVQAFGDGGRIIQVLHQLLKNAVQYAGKGAVCLDASIEKAEADSSDLSFALRGRQCTLKLSITDTGRGCPTEELRRVFQPKGDEASVTKTGMGLAVVQKVCSAKQWTIKYASKEGMGTTFTIRVKLSQLRYQSGRSSRSSGLRAGLSEDDLKLRAPALVSVTEHENDTPIRYRHRSAPVTPRDNPVTPRDHEPVVDAKRENIPGLETTDYIEVGGADIKQSNRKSPCSPGRNLKIAPRRLHNPISPTRHSRTVFHSSVIELSFADHHSSVAPGSPFKSAEPKTFRFPEFM
eukprot:gb/GEZN01002562.1/.p1 GENE.gb/GEZN01002562.1/~~gb/GEZN01002562.1/.p1  ORF type:complete len:521 (+),score=31.10 gb/GEZN01002562.1/:175-1563(+)